MKKSITFFLSLFSILGAAPTAWAIYAGITKQPAFPVWHPVAVVGAMAVISTTAAAGLLIVDILKHNSESSNVDEQKMNLPAWWGWAILAGCTVAEITLSLLIVIYSNLLEWGVLAFPLVTIAGVFALAVRMTLQERITDRQALRIQQAQAQAEAITKQEQEAREVQARHEQELALRRELRRTAKESKRTAADSAPVQSNSVVPASKYPRKCDYCDAILEKSNAIGGHMKKHHPELCKKPALADSLFGQVKP